jgi:nucleotide-binding universal stress UspA family protein
MLSLAHILLPTDFSPRVTAIARYAAALARHFHARLTILHAVPPLDLSWGASGYSVMVEEVCAHQKERARQQLDRFLDEELREFQVDRVLVEGDPAETILEYAHSHPVDLIMMPTRGCGPFRRFIIGSVTAKVLHDAHCPVWTGEHIEELRSERSSTPEVIVCAVDLIPESAASLAWAARLAASFHSRLVAVHAIPSLEFSPETYYLEADLRRFLIGDARSKIAKLLKDSEMPDAEIRVKGGSIPRVVRFAAEDSRADLLIIGRSAGTGVLGRLRTHAYAIIRESPCPVISL